MFCIWKRGKIYGNIRSRLVPAAIWAVQQNIYNKISADMAVDTNPDGTTFCSDAFLENIETFWKMSECLTWLKNTFKKTRDQVDPIKGTRLCRLLLIITRHIFNAHLKIRACLHNGSSSWPRRTEVAQHKWSLGTFLEPNMRFRLMSQIKRWTLWYRDQKCPGARNDDISWWGGIPFHRLKWAWPVGWARDLQMIRQRRGNVQKEDDVLSNPQSSESGHLHDFLAPAAFEIN